MGFLLAAAAFVCVLLLAGEVYFILVSISRPEVREARRRLRALAATAHGAGEIDIVKRKALSEVPLLNRFLLNLPWAGRMERLLEIADSPYPAGFYMLGAMLLALSGWFVFSLIFKSWLTALPVALLAGGLPFWSLLKRKRKRLAALSRELPDALDMVARAMKAGHALTGGLRMVAEEFEGPVGVEFGKTLEEINFGLGAPEALKNLAARVNQPDVDFLVISVLIQRETGGNLAEILENLSHIIRERFKFKGKIRALSAEGRLSAIILAAIPILVAFALMILNPKYLKVLTADPIGNVLLVFSVVTMVLGIFVMKRMVNIEV